ncbi:unnamed protein product [Hyaloperonospora brassicae]|uniref:Srp40 C-terminal domain-containing protein n=1 Tax=Hyaloperonospora brassicae TaxID=162125 RepID=A0AAV0UTZ3_HYABA|nr:unnamed protein product [Hyaloperonospora brassicae]
MTVASDVLPLIHALLTRSGLRKAATALAKEAKLQPQALESTHDLVDVYSYYVTHKVNGSKREAATRLVKENTVTKEQKKKKKEEEKEKSSGSLDSSEAEKEKQLTGNTGSRSSGQKKEKGKTVLQDTEEKERKKTKSSVKAAEKRGSKKVAESRSSDSSSDSSDEEVEGAKTLVRKRAAADTKKVKAKAMKNKSSSSDSSSDSSDESESDDEAKSKIRKRKTEALPAEKNTKKVKRDVDSSSEASSSSDDNSSDSSDSSDSDSDSSADEVTRKKEAARRDEAAKAALAWQPMKMVTVATKVKSAGTPFQRVDGEFWSQKIVNDTLRDNSYEGTFGTDGVGVKANAKLLMTRGKDFTKGKNKLKRSTYMCGAISMASNSFKFED